MRRRLVIRIYFIELKKIIDFFFNNDDKKGRGINCRFGMKGIIAGILIVVLLNLRY